MRRHLVLLALASVAILALAACGRETPTQIPTQTPAATSAPTSTATTPATSTPGPAQPGSPKVLKADVQRTSPADVSDADLESVTEGSAEFAFDLYRQLKDAEKFRGENLFYSPFSISLALAMTSAGAAGTTASQMADTLHLELPPERLHPAMNVLDQKMAGNDEFELSIANSLWGQDGFAFKQSFLEELARSYGAGMRLVDFVDATNRETARQAINGWVEDETNDRIKDIVPQGALTDMTRLVLANAIYFKADWTYQFSKEATQDRPFNLADGSAVDVSTMYRSNMQLQYADLEGYQVVELPYKGTEVSMLVLLPDEGELEALEDSINSRTLSDTIERLESRTVSVTMPKFEFTSDVALKEHLQALGMEAPFDFVQANFSGIADPATAQLYIQDALHKAFVKVDEEGTEAAAATVVIVGTTSMPTDVVDLVVDRPFLFLIRDGETGATLFVGRVMDPRP